MVTHLKYSRTYPVPVDVAYARVLPVPLQDVLGRRFLVVAGVRSTEQTGEWGSAGVGQQRRIRFTDGGTARETLTGLEVPHWFGYHLDSFTGPLKLLIGGVDGRWSFTPEAVRDHVGTRVTWSWEVTPASRVAERGMPLLRWFWTGFARQGFDDIGKLLSA
ncbi:SRPBCC family protein [Spongisporangium articulatum]|uniref:SRPBCC family protein n=1 Tax=Spongisporangium articulatum TaxID=3362603 RepID=A0ABW8ATE8_9ACTN